AKGYPRKRRRWLSDLKSVARPVEGYWVVGGVDVSLRYFVNFGEKIRRGRIEQEDLSSIVTFVREAGAGRLLWEWEVNLIVVRKTMMILAKRSLLVGGLLMDKLALKVGMAIIDFSIK
ncbi:unnamed protein product, partial [Dovyalis caffra]